MSRALFLVEVEVNDEELKSLNDKRTKVGQQHYSVEDRVTDEVGKGLVSKLFPSVSVAKAEPPQ